jgi:hypothetical protein
MQNLAGSSRQSRTVQVADAMTDRQKAALGITGVHLDVFDAIFDGLQLLVDDEDQRPLMERLGDVSTLIDNPGKLLIFFEEIAAAQSLPRWINRWKQPNFDQFVRRLLGAGRHEQLQRAFREDATVFTVAVRRGIRHLLPVASAFDGCMKALDPADKKRIDGLDRFGTNSILELVVSIDRGIANLDTRGLSLNSRFTRSDELVELPPSLEAIVKLQSKNVSAETSRLLADLSGLLARKLQGARDALQHSADSVSQAANSLIELIDRMMRLAFTDDEVLRWIEESRPNQISDLAQRTTPQRPTKRGQALCLVYGGVTNHVPQLPNELAASVLVAVRTRLQGLKHADTGTDIERQALAETMTTIEGCLLLFAHVIWVAVPHEQLQTIAARLGAAA